MAHGRSLSNGTASYRNRFIRTKGFFAEQAAGESLWTGIMEPVRQHSGVALKDTANTDRVVHTGHLLALWWMSGTPGSSPPGTSPRPHRTPSAAR